MDILINHHKFFSATDPVEPANFGQAINRPYQFNCIKLSFAQYYRNYSFVILMDPLPYAILTSNTCVLCSVLSPIINQVTYNLHRYFSHHCANGVPQFKGIIFGQSFSLVLNFIIFRFVIALAGA